MKKIMFVLVALVFLASCKDKFYAKYKKYVPVYMDETSFRAAVKFESAKEISQKGNIYLKDEMLYIVEPNKGIHFVDNSNPSAPNKFGFLNVPGCSNVAVKGNVMYISSLIDLVCVDISNKYQAVEINRIKNVFPNATAVTAKNYPKETIDPSKGLVVDWNVIDVKEETDALQNNNWEPPVNNVDFLSVNTTTNTNSSGSSGISGSISKFTIVNDYLYVYDDHKLTPINIANASNPIAAQGVQIWNNVETLFPHNDFIFMGTTSGMVIYSVSNPEAPQYVSSVSHVTACDPVVVDGNYAYVTVRSNSFCGGNINQLEVIDISNIQYPVSKAIFSMKEPHGLGISDELLFICDGTSGLKIYDAKNPETSGDNLIKQYKDIQATDVIPHNKNAIVIGDDGLYQYDFTESDDIKLLSKISFNH